MIVINEPGLAAFFSPAGPVGVLLLDKARRVEERARENASGPILGIRSGDLLGGLKSELGVDEPVVYATVGTDAVHREFNYPAFQDRNGRPWLTQAADDVFR